MVTIDRLGRIVVPKAVRDSLGLAPGTRLDLVEEPDGFRIVVPTTEALVEEADGLPLIVSRRVEPLTDDDVDALVADPAVLP
jgi:AbrB family looped-hinge helix DNA binding protein